MKREHNYLADIHVLNHKLTNARLEILQLKEFINDSENIRRAYVAFKKSKE